MSKLIDGGERTSFDTGAVREPTVGEGRFDLLPFDIVADLFKRSDISTASNISKWFDNLYYFMKDTQCIDLLYNNIEIICELCDWDLNMLLLEVTKQYEDGAKKYSENNYANGIPLNNYIDHAARHFVKFLAGWTDEPHNRAVIWNLISAIWVVKHKPTQNNLNNKSDKNLTTFEET